MDSIHPPAGGPPTVGAVVPIKGAWKFTLRRPMSLGKPWKLIDNNVKVTTGARGLREAGGLG